MRFSARPTEYPPSALIFVGLGLLSVVCLLDRFTGSSSNFAFFYLIPIYFISWYVGAAAGVGFAILSAIAMALAQSNFDIALTFFTLRNPNSISAFAFFLLTALLLSRLSAAYRRERDLSSHDYLTGVFNRREFFHLAEVERLRAIRYARAMTLVYMDIDEFKDVNDRFGHAAGDALLGVVAKALKASVRATDLVARLGGDEFILLLEETDADAARLIVSQLREGLATQLSETSCPVTASMGVITFMVPPASVDEMVCAADELMYSAKRDGGNRAIFRVSLGSYSGPDSKAAPA